MSYIREKSIRLAHTCFLLCRSFIHRATDRGRAVSPSLRRWPEDLQGCRWIRFMKSALTRPLTSSSYDAWSTVNRFSGLSFISHNGDLVVRYVVRLSYLCSSTWVNLDLCSNSVIDINYNYIFLCVLWLIKLFLWSVNFVTVVTVSLCLSLCNPYIHTT
jgi:hypothetical protein